MEEWISWTGLGRIADIASLVAAVLSFWAVRRLGALRKQLVTNARLDPLLEKIRNALSGLKELEERYPGERVAIRSSMKGCLAVIYRHERQLPRDVQGIIKKLRKLEKRLQDDHSDGDSVIENDVQIIEELSEELAVLLDLLEETKVSLQLGGNDA